MIASDEEGLRAGQLIAVFDFQKGGFIRNGTGLFLRGTMEGATGTS